MHQKYNSYGLRTLFSRLLRGGWYRLQEDSRIEIPNKRGNTKIVLSNAYLDKHFVYADAFEFQATEYNIELWQAFRDLIYTDKATAMRILALPANLYALIGNATDAELGRISQRFFCSFRLKPNCLSLLNDAFSKAPDTSLYISPAHKKFLTLYWLNVWSIAKTQPSRACSMFDLPLEVVYAISTFSPLRMLHVIEGLTTTVYELRFNPCLIEAIFCYPDDAMIFVLMQMQQAIQKNEDVQYSLSWHEPEIDIDEKAVIKDYDNHVPTQEICKKYKISRFKLVSILQTAQKINSSFLRENELLTRRIQAYQKELAELLTIWGLAPKAIRAITGLTAAQFRTIREKLIDQELLSSSYNVNKLVGARRSKLRLGDKIIASLYLSIYSRLGTSNIYKTVNIPAMIIAQIVIEEIIQTPFFAPLQPNPFNPTDAWLWARDLQASKVKFIHCPKCGSLYIAEYDDEETEQIPEDEEYDPNRDYSHPCPYCRFIDTYCSFGFPVQTQSALLNRKINRDAFFNLLEKKVAPFEL